MAALLAQEPQVSLSADDVRLMTLRAQGFVGADGRRGGVPAMLRRLGAVQLDTISVLARSHELVAYARLGPVCRDRIERAYWHPRRPAAFEYWSHAACVLPIEDWPYYAFRRRALRDRGKRWHQSHQRTCAEVLARLRAEGPLTATQLGGAVKGDGEVGGGAWWDWSETKIAVEWLLDVGDVICVRREGWRRVYDLPDRVLPGDLLAHEPTDSECLAHLAAAAARSLGVVTRADLIDHHRLRELTTPATRHADRVDEAAEAAGLTPVAVGTSAAGRGNPAAARNGLTMGWADPGALAQAAGGVRGRHRVTLLSPFDSLVWDRKRTRRMFGFDHSLEAYVPRAKRVHGYFAMPLLAGGRLAGRVDPVRRGQTLVARQLSLTSAATTIPMARALREAAEWVGCSAVAVERVEPPHLAQRLRAGLA